MTWKEVVKTAKYKWVVIEVIKAKSENGKSYRRYEPFSRV